MRSLVALAVAASLAAFAAGAAARPDAGSGSRADTLKRGAAFEGKRISLKALKRPVSKVPGKFEEANPKQSVSRKATFRKLGNAKPITALGDFGRLDSKGRSDPRKGKALPKLRKPQGRSSSNDLVLFRNQPISDSGVGSSTNEPSAGNDRNAILFTGNWYTAYSSNNGIDFQFVDPKALASPGTDFCCDQVVNASDENDHELVAWLLQYAVSDTNTIRIATYQGRQDLLTSLSSLTPCVYDFDTSRLHLPSDRRLDYNAMETTDGWLYISSNVYSISKDSDGHATAHGSIFWRLKLDDLTDGNCSLGYGFDYLADEDNQSLRFVTGAGSTMYWASHEDTGSTIRVYHIADSELTLHSTVKTLSDWSSSSYTCKVSDTAKHDPCADNDSRIVAGWKGDGEIGFLWSAGKGGDFDWPYVRGARFKTSDLSLAGEIALYNDDFAIQNPSAGVNADGDVGVIFYRMGGSYHPSPRAFIVDSVTPSWSGVDTTGIKTGKYSPDENRWGDYGSVSAYDGCSKTFLATAYTMEYGEDHSNDTQPRVVWFGREKNGCPDLQVESFAWTYRSDINQLILADSTRNTGGADAAATKTRFYVSRDTDLSSGDTRIDATHDVPALAASESNAALLVSSLPEGLTAGTYYILACADDTEVVDDEVSESNNCNAYDKTVTIAISIAKPSKLKDLAIGSLRAEPGGPTICPGCPIHVKDDIRITADDAVPAVVRYYLNATRFLDGTKIELGIREIPGGWGKLPNPPKPTPIPVWSNVADTVLTIPKTVKPGLYYVIACVEPKTTLVEKDATNNCRATTLAFRIVPGR